jgi:hypothetical protein
VSLDVIIQGVEREFVHFSTCHQLNALLGLAFLRKHDAPTCHDLHLTILAPGGSGQVADLGQYRLGITFPVESSPMTPPPSPWD